MMMHMSADFPDEEQGGGRGEQLMREADDL